MLKGTGKGKVTNCTINCTINCMPKQILVIPDIHGRRFWREPVHRMIDDVDRVVFLGDYLDPYPDEGVVYSPEELRQNLTEIVALKQEQPEKVVLLKGNHDQHYASEKFRETGCGTRFDRLRCRDYHKFFNDHAALFKLVHKERVGEQTYVFSHAGITMYWLHKVNSMVWHLADNKLSLSDDEVIERINALDDCGIGQEMLAVVGRSRSFLGEKTGSVLWADIDEHSIPHSHNAYGLNEVFQVFGHTRLDGSMMDMIEYDNLAMVDSQRCFLVDEASTSKILPLDI